MGARVGERPREVQSESKEKSAEEAVLQIYSTSCECIFRHNGSRSESIYMKLIFRDQQRLCFERK